jgi:hypothetical protein
LDEDAPYGDITSQTLIPADARATAVLAARVPGVLSGGEVFSAAMKLTDPVPTSNYSSLTAPPSPPERRSRGSAGMPAPSCSPNAWP